MERVVAHGRIKARFDRWDANGTGDLSRADFEDEADRIAAAFDVELSAPTALRLRAALAGLFEFCAHQAGVRHDGPITEVQFHKAAEDLIFEQGEAAFNRALRPVVDAVIGLTRHRRAGALSGLVGSRTLTSPPSRRSSGPARSPPAPAGVAWRRGGGTVTRRVAVIGMGAISAYYLRAIESRPDWRLVAVCDVRPAALAGVSPEVARFHDHHELFEAVELDAVIVTVPNDAHAAVCKDALRRGIPVCVEKPLAVSWEDGRELSELSQNGPALLTSFHRRYNDNIRRVHREVTERGGAAALRVRYLERIEEHIGGDTWYLDPQRCGGGCVADNGPNAFDLVRLFLQDPEIVHATVVYDDQDVDRQAVIELSAGCVPAVVELDWSYPGEVKDVEVAFADGTRLHADMLAGHSGFKTSLWHEYEGVLDEFSAAISAGTRPHDGGLAALELVYHTYRHAHAVTGKAPA